VSSLARVSVSLCAVASLHRLRAGAAWPEERWIYRFKQPTDQAVLIVYAQRGNGSHRCGSSSPRSISSSTGWRVLTRPPYTRLSAVSAAHPPHLVGTLHHVGILTQLQRQTFVLYAVAASMWLPSLSASFSRSSAQLSSRYLCFAPRALA